MKYPNYEGLTDATLKELHASIRKCLDADDQNSGEDKVYGVRKYSDWKEANTKIEAEMTRRNIVFDSIQL